MSYKLYEWDKYSDQPAVIKNKRMKRSLYLRGMAGSLKTFVSALILPAVGISVLLTKKTLIGSDTAEQDFGIGLCVNPDVPLPEKHPINTDDLISQVETLGVSHLLLRIPLADIERLDEYLDLAKRLCAIEKQPSLLVNILQDRRHIEDPDLFTKSLRKVFSSFSGLTKNFQIGNSVNRRKWSFVSLDEYFRFFSVAQKLRNWEFPNMKLIGGNIIDFELPNFARSVFHLHKIKYDACAAQLYVDRRGAPENKHLGCDTQRKIHWFSRMIQLSSKTTDELWITEVNWPLEGTEPFAPAVGDCMVNESDQSAYLTRYYLLAMATGKVHRCYWHQLVAPGYGLIDNRGNDVRRRDAFFAFKTLITIFADATITNFKLQANGLYKLDAKNHRGQVTAIWSNNQPLEGNLDTLIPYKVEQITDHLGNVQTYEKNQRLLVSGQPLILTDHCWE